MIIIIAAIVLISLYFVVPKGTLLHEILRLPYYNYKAQTARKDDMLMEKYSFGDHRRQYFMFFLPKDSIVTQDQVIVYYHGGGWTFGNPMMFRCNAQFFVDQGYAVVMPSYRRLPFHRCPDMQEDARLALKKTIQVMEEKGLGDKKLILSGLSAGGHLAAITAYDQNQWTAIGVSRDRLSAIMLFAPPLDLSKMALTPVVWNLAGWPNSNLFRTSNPINYLSANESTPLLLLHGTRDGLVNYKSSLSFSEKRGSEQLTFHTIKNGTHLDSGYWVFFENEAQGMIMEWLEGIGS